jgi:hypothetical protein
MPSTFSNAIYAHMAYVYGIYEKSYDSTAEYQIEEHLAASFRDCEIPAQHLIPDMENEDIIYIVQHSLAF